MNTDKHRSKRIQSIPICVHPSSSVAILLLLLANSSAAADSIPVGSRLEPFVDTTLIESTKNAEPRLTLPERKEIVLTLDQPWESNASAYFTAFKDGDKVRLYYRGVTTDDDSHDQTTCLAESPDGVHFTRPNLGLYDFRGSKDNNIVYVGPESAAFAPFKDPNPAAKPDEKYKAVCYRVVKKQGTVSGLASPDGLHWHRLSEDPLLPPGTFDSLNTAQWDPAAKVYRLFGRYWTGGNFRGVRGIQSSTSPDFLHWSKPEPFHYAEGVPLEHFYTNAIVPHPGAEHILLSFPKRFLPDRTKNPAHGEPGLSDAVFMTSRDAGLHWDRTFLEAWLRPGADPDNWAERSNMPACGILQTSPDEFSMYVSEHYRTPTNRLRRLTIPRDRFASMHAPAAGGEFTTKPLTFTGKRLILNYATSAAGSVQIDVLGADNKPLTSSPTFFGDQFDFPVPWQGGSDLSKITGQPIRLRFVLKDADVYALHFAD
jgi:hypothetical protein